LKRVLRKTLPGVVNVHPGIADRFATQGLDLPGDNPLLLLEGGKTLLEDLVKLLGPEEGSGK
jgi:hypothetical protein